MKRLLGSKTANTAIIYGSDRGVVVVFIYFDFIVFVWWFDG